MPKFTLIKHPDHETDSKIEVTFFTEFLSDLDEFFEDFVAASGFERQAKEERSIVPPIDPEDWMWDDAFESVFGKEALKDDGLVGSAGADIIHFPQSDT